MPTEVRGAANKIEHSNRTDGTGVVTVTPNSPANFILIDNTHATQNVLVSFDAGTTFKTIKPGVTLTLDVSQLKSYQIKGSAAGTTSEALHGLED